MLDWHLVRTTSGAERAACEHRQHAEDRVLLPRKLWQSAPSGTSATICRGRREPACAREATNRKVRQQAVDLTEAIGFLQSSPRRQVDQLSEILNRGFREWTRRNGCSGTARG